MPLDPSISWKQYAVVDQTFYKTILLVGQSNVATAGIYKDLHLKTVNQINTMFGADSHLAFLIKDSLTMFQGFVKPKIMAVSYKDNLADVKRVLNLEITGTSTEQKTLQVKINSLNPDRISTQTVSAFASFFTEDAFCIDYSRNGKLIRGSIKNTASGYHPVFSTIYNNDVIVEIDITEGMTQNQIATLINTKINASVNALYDSTVLDNDLTLTATHKGIIGQNFTFEIVQSTIPAGVSFNLTQTTAGSGVIDTSSILDITDEEGVKLSSLRFDYVVIPYGFSITNLVNDAKAKFDNVLEYNNRCLDYYIFQSTSIDLSSDVALDSLASANPTTEKGLARCLIILEKKDNFTNKGVFEYDKRYLIKLKQFTPFQIEEDKTFNLGNCSSLSNNEIYADLTKLFSVSIIRKLYVETFIPEDFTGAENYDANGISNTLNYTKSDIEAFFENYRDYVDGTLTTHPIYKDRFSGLIKRNDEVRSQYNEILANSIYFDSSQTLNLSLMFNLVETIKNLFISSYNK